MEYTLTESITTTFTITEQLRLLQNKKGKLLDSKTENALPRWFELGTKQYLDASSQSSSVLKLNYFSSQDHQVSENFFFVFMKEK